MEKDNLVLKGLIASRFDFQVMATEYNKKIITTASTFLFYGKNLNKNIQTTKKHLETK